MDYRYQILPSYAKPGRLGCITVFTIAMSTVDGVDYRYQILPLVHRVIGHDSAPQDMLRTRESCPLGLNELPLLHRVLRPRESYPLGLNEMLQRYSHVH